MEIDLAEKDEEPAANNEADKDENQSVIRVPEKVTRQQLLAVCWQVRPW